MDEIDEAQERSQLFLDQALARHFGRSAEYPLRKGLPPRLATVHGAGQATGPRLCTECGDEIDADRLSANPQAMRCFGCQNKYERRTRLGLV